MEILYSRALGHFVAAFDQGNIRKAAAVVGVTQPAISKSIQKLESYIGTELFDRTSEGVRPTPIAHILRRHAKNILNEARFVETEMSSLLEGHFGSVRLGVGPAWSLTVFPKLLEKFCDQFPQIDIEVEVGVTDHLLPSLEEGKLDFWLGSMHGIRDSDEIIAFTSGSAELRVFCRERHVLAKKAKVKASDMEGHSWATFVNDKRGLEKLQLYFHERGLGQPRLQLRLGSMVTMFRAAAQSDHLVLAADTLGTEARACGLTELESEGCIWRFPTGMAFRRNAAHLAVTKFLLSHLSTIERDSLLSDAP